MGSFIEKTPPGRPHIPAALSWGLPDAENHNIRPQAHSFTAYCKRRKAAFPDLKAGTWGGKGEEALFGDLGVKDVGKAAAVGALADHLHADRKDTVAFGDAKVDIPMLECCACGVAMGNGGPEIKAMADYVADGVEQDGLYKAFQALGLLDGED